MREGALLRSLRRHRLASVLSNVADRSAALPPRHPAAVLTSAGTAAVVAAAMAEADKAAAAAARGKPPPQVIPDVYRALITTHVPSPTAAAQIPSSRTISPAEISSRLARLASSISFADAIADARAASMRPRAPQKELARRSAADVGIIPPTRVPMVDEPRRMDDRPSQARRSPSPTQ